MGDTPLIRLTIGEITGYTTIKAKIKKPDDSTFEVGYEDITVVDVATGEVYFRALSTDFDIAGVYRIHMFPEFSGGLGYHSKTYLHEVVALYT